jgi:hypothetical protein
LRRPDKIFRPPTLAIRFLNPWRRLRTNLLGWYVLFGIVIYSPTTKNLLSNATWQLFWTRWYTDFIHKSQLSTRK